MLLIPLLLSFVIYYFLDGYFSNKTKQWKILIAIVSSLTIFLLIILGKSWHDSYNMKKDTENNNVSEIKSKETIESTRKCLVGADWILKPANRVIAAWKFSEDGTFNFSTEALGGCSAWGNWKIISPDKIQINYTRFTGGINLNDEIITLTDCNSLKSGKIEYSKQEGSVNEDISSIDGTYLYKDDSAELEITISGDTWTGKTTVITGFGSDYDNQNTNYDNGIVKNNNLYNSSGTVKVGYINGNSLITSVGEHSVTLLKN